jgi:hypothetical protein
MATVDYMGMLKFCFPRLGNSLALSPGTGQPLEDETTTPGKYLRSCTDPTELGAVIREKPYWVWINTYT